MKHFIVIPFKPTDRYKWGNDAETFDTIFNTMKKPGSLNSYALIKKTPNLTDLKNAHGAETRIYVLGHGAAGLDKISNGNGKEISSSELFTFLKSAGLPKNQQTTLKLFSCSSALNDGANLSFARRMYDILQREGYIQCTVMGYEGPTQNYWGEAHKKGWDLTDVEKRASEIRKTMP